jgi:hypothetical protein
MEEDRLPKAKIKYKWRGRILQGRPQGDVSFRSRKRLRLNPLYVEE